MISLVRVSVWAKSRGQIVTSVITPIESIDLIGKLIPALLTSVTNTQVNPDTHKVDFLRYPDCHDDSQSTPIQVLTGPDGCD
jgi:hypothetical protein